MSEGKRLPSVVIIALYSTIINVGWSPVRVRPERKIGSKRCPTCSARIKSPWRGCMSVSATRPRRWCANTMGHTHSIRTPKTFQFLKECRLEVLELNFKYVNPLSACLVPLFPSLISYGPDSETAIISLNGTIAPPPPPQQQQQQSVTGGRVQKEEIHRCLSICLPRRRRRRRRRDHNKRDEIAPDASRRRRRRRRRRQKGN